ncbi:hypothetical protein AYI70_g10637, partial [Smittium culicis]
SESTQSESTQSESTQSESTQSESTQSESTQSESTLFKSTMSQLTQSKSTQPESTQPESTQPESTQSESTQPESTQSKSTQSESTQSESTQSESTQPESTQSESTSSECGYTLGEVKNIEGSGNSEDIIYDYTQGILIPCTSIEFSFSFQVDQTSDVYFYIDNGDKDFGSGLLFGTIGAFSGLYRFGNQYLEFNDVIIPEIPINVEISSNENQISLSILGKIIITLDNSEYDYVNTYSLREKTFYFGAVEDGSEIQNIHASCNSLC